METLAQIHKAMTIAGSDVSGGAGMEADLKTFEEMGVYGMTALTVIVAQNPENSWAHDIYPIELGVIDKQGLMWYVLHQKNKLPLYRLPLSL